MSNHDHLRSVPTTTDYEPELWEAIQYASTVHAGEWRKLTGDQFIVHPIGVMELLPPGTDVATKQAAVLHDTVECTDTTIEDLRRMFGQVPAHIVWGVTKDYRIADRTGRKHAYLHRLRHEALPESVEVSLADKLHNVSDLVRNYEQFGDEMFAYFKTPSDEQLWWNEQVLAIGRDRLPGYPLNDQLEEQVYLYRTGVMGHTALSGALL